mgnify:CR=1 FL=1
MANRPIFTPNLEKIGVKTTNIDFKWHGIFPEQKKKSITELHHVANECGISNILDISSKSEVYIGIQLSAFNLIITTKKHKQRFTVEMAFQGSKVFENGGPYTDLLYMTSLAAKQDPRLKSSGSLIAFRFFNIEFPLLPRTYFYDWLYINALVQNPTLAKDVLRFDSFSDIEFNPQHSINCQAHSVALYISLYRQNLLAKALESPANFLKYCYE